MIDSRDGKLPGESLRKQLVSVVMLSYNNLDVIGYCLDALLKNLHKNIEIIIIDCGSKDGSQEFISNNYPQVRLSKFKSDPGVDNAYTLGVSLAKSKFVLLVSADVLVLPNTIENLLKSLVEKSLDIAVPVTLNWDGSYVNAGLGFPYLTVSSFSLGSILRVLMSSIKTEKPFFFSFACCLMLKQVYMENVFNQHIGFYEDVEWAWRLDLKRVNVSVLDNVYCLHKIGASMKGKRAQYYNALSPLATSIICMNATTFAFMIPLLWLKQVTKFISLIFGGRSAEAKSFARGWADFLRLRALYLEDHKKLLLMPGTNNSSYYFLKRVVESENYVRKRRYLLGKVFYRV